MTSKMPAFMDILKDSWEKYKANWKYLAKVYLLGYLYILGALLISVLVLASVYFLLPSPASFIIIGIGVVLAIVILCYLGYWFALAMGKAASSLDHRDKIPPARLIYKQTKKFIGVYFLVTLIQSSITIGGYIALIIPGVIFSLWFSMTLFTVLIDGKKGASALILSREYVRGRVGTVFLYYLGYGVLVSVLIGWLPSFILEQLELNVLSVIVNMIVSFIIYHLGIIFSYNLYKALKATKGDSPIDYGSRRRRKYILASFIPVVGLAIVVAFIIATHGFADIPIAIPFQEAY